MLLYVRIAEAPDCTSWTADRYPLSLPGRRMVPAKEQFITLSHRFLHDKQQVYWASSTKTRIAETYWILNSKEVRFGIRLFYDAVSDAEQRIWINWETVMKEDFIFWKEVFVACHFNIPVVCPRPPLWSSGQSSWLQIQRSRVWFPALPDFLSRGSGTGSTQPREDNWGATWMEK
jgi:hypothetical protein